MFLGHLGIEYTVQRYESVDCWNATKDSLGLDFPTLPYLIDGDVKLSYLIPILRYLARKYDHEGSLLEMSELESNRIALVEQHIFLQSSSSRDASNQVELLSNELEQLSRFLSEHGHFVAGERLSYVDFLLYEHLHRIEVECGDDALLDRYPNLRHYVDRVEVLPEIYEYLALINRASPEAVASDSSVGGC